MTGQLRAHRTGLLLTALGLVACSTYDASLLSVSLDPSQTGGSTSGGTGGVLVGPGGRDSGGTGGGNDAGFGGITAGMAGDEAIAGSDGSAAAAGTDVDVAGGGSGAANTGGAGLGGATGGAGSGSAGLGGAAGGASPYELIDDFEDGDTTLYPLYSLPVAQWRNGNWYTIQDATATGTKGPFFPIVLLSTVADTRPGSALHFTASGFTDWGAGVGADFRKVNGVKVPYDVSAYKGIRFYARVATATQTALKVLVPTTYSDPQGGKCGAPGATCGDHFFCQVSSIKTTWAAYECSFTDLRQQSLKGALVQASFDPSTVYSVQFSLMTSTLPADLWLDDVSFILK